MEDSFLIERFPHIIEKIFEKLDNKSLTRCRGVCKKWQRFIDERKMPWIRIVNFPSILKGIFLCCQKIFLIRAKINNLCHLNKIQVVQNGKNTHSKDMKNCHKVQMF